jgi:hypothetical protein
VTIVVHACGVRGCVVERSVPETPSESRRARCGSSPCSIIGSITENVAASSPMTVSAGVDTTRFTGTVWKRIEGREARMRGQPSDLANGE